MAIGVTLIIVIAIVVFIWVFFEFKRFKHKFFAILLILLIIFTYFSFVAAIKGQNIDFGSVEGLKTAGKLYFAWLGNAFNNIKLITTNVIKMDWGPNSSMADESNPEETEGNSK